MTHSQRSTYLRGCRCSECREANRVYAIRQRRTNETRKVSATRARNHLLKLAAEGVGSKAAADASDITRFTIVRIRSARTTLIRRRTSEAILKLTKEAVADRGLIRRERLDEILSELLEEGFTKAEIKRRMGYKGAALPFMAGERIQARSLMRIEKFHRKVMAA